MLHYRSFRNSDPPAMLEIWRSLAGQPGLLQPISIDVLEQFVMSRLYFDPAGLWLAWDDDRPVGMAHAGFGPRESEDRIDREMGTTCLLLTRPDCPRDEVAGELLKRCEQYLMGRGAKVIYGGGIRPLNPFYLGLYGGSELPGVLASDEVACRAFASHGYREIDRTVTFRGELHRIQVPVTRHLMQLRRSMLVHVTTDPPTRNWWEACTMGHFELVRFHLCARTGGPSVAHALVRNMDPTSSFGEGRSAGLIELQVDPSHRRRGLVTYLLTEMFHQMIRQGVFKVDVQTMHNNIPAVRLYSRLGFEEVDQGIVFRKEGPYA